VTIQEKYPRFIAPQDDRSLGIEFECWKPDPTLAALKQSYPSQDWKGGSLDAIPASGALPHVDVPELLKKMVNQCWQRAGRSSGETRGRIALGGTVTFRDKTSGQLTFGGRQLSHDLLRSGSPAEAGRAQAQVMAGRHVRQVQPLIAQEAARPDVHQNNTHLQGIANDWSAMRALPRVNAYTFRGDTRAPRAIAQAGGFGPPITRTDEYYVDRVVKPAFKSYMKRRFDEDVSDADFTRAINQVAPANSAQRHVLNNYFVWRALTENESFHLGRMLADEALKGYISTTRAVAVARGFAKEHGWVYLTRVRGGFVVPDKGTTTWTRLFGEQEIALPCKLGWDDVFGFRQVDRLMNLTGPIYFRKGFDAERIAFSQAYELLSGKPQS